MTPHLRYSTENQVSGVMPRKDVAYRCGGGGFETNMIRNRGLEDLRNRRISCGSCGYALNLRSSNRNTSNIDSKYGKALRKGNILFVSIDESKFTKVDELKCLPYFMSKHYWGFLKPRTKLLCRKCGNVVGHAYEESISPLGSAASDSSPGTGMAMCRKYSIRIRALQPSSDEINLPLIA